MILIGALTYQYPPAAAKKLGLALFPQCDSSNTISRKCREYFRRAIQTDSIAVGINHSQITSGFRWAALAAAIILGLAKSQAVETSDGNDTCRVISDFTVQKQCYAIINTLSNKTNAQGQTLLEGWQLVRTPDPRGGADAISISHVADLQKSDPNLAGITLRCVNRQIEIFMIVIEPYPPNIPINLSLKLGNNSASTYRGNIVPPGVMVRLPPEAATAIFDRRPQFDDLNVSLAYGTAPVTTGLVKLTGLEQALGTLKTLCAEL